MKFTELKKHLSTNTYFPAYTICGEDIFLCYRALDMFTARFGNTVPEMNTNVFSSEKVDMQQVVDACLMPPFGDAFRLVIVKPSKVKFTNSDMQLLKTYIKKPSTTTICVFFFTETNESAKSVSACTEPIICEHLDVSMAHAWVQGKIFGPTRVQIKPEAMQLLYAYCNADLARITSEAQKLASFVGENGVIDGNMVKTFVEQDKEYKIFELTDKIAQKDAEGAMDVFTTLMKNEKTAYAILTPLYTHFRRLLYISLLQSTQSQAWLAEKFGIKEWAVKMMFAQVKQYSPKLLKKIVDSLECTDENIKSGKMKEDIAVNLAIMNILIWRGAYAKHNHG